MRKRSVVTILGFATASLIGCRYGDWPARYDSFFEMPRDQRRSAILTYEPSDQLWLHVHATCDVHPPYEGLARIIVEQRGATLLDPLRRAVAETARQKHDRSCRAHALSVVVNELANKGIGVDPSIRDSLTSPR